MKLTGKGGTVSIGGAAKANVTQFDFTESKGVIRGNTQGQVNFTAILETAAGMIRVDSEIDLVLTVGDPAAITITMDNSWVDSASMPVVRNNAVTQSVSATCYTTPSIA